MTYDVAGLTALHSAVCAHLHPTGDDDEDFQGRVPVVVVGADPVGVLASLEAARFAPVLVVELSVHVAARGGVHGGRCKGGEDLTCRREWRRPNTPGGSDLDLICALQAVLPARVPASMASAGSRGKVLFIGTKVLTSIARCCG